MLATADARKVLAALILGCRDECESPPLLAVDGEMHGALFGRELFIRLMLRPFHIHSNIIQTTPPINAYGYEKKLLIEVFWFHYIPLTCCTYSSRG